MELLNVGLSSWIIQDGNYADFSVGQETQFALEFYSPSLKSSECNRRSAVSLIGSQYQTCGQVVFRAEDVCVLDIGFLAYQQDPPPHFTEGTWVEGEIYLGIDHFAYFEGLKNTPGMPQLTYNFRIHEILLETTPWLTTADASGRKIMVRDEQNTSYREVSKTDAWNDDNEHAHYILRCVSTDGRI